MSVKPIAKALSEVRTAVVQIMLFNSFMDTLVMFLLLYLGSVLLSLPIGYALVATIVYAVIHTRGNLKEASFKSIEKKFPALKEQLITAADNYKDQNEIVNSLCEDVIEKMRDIKTSSFLDFGKLTRELSVMAVISFVIIGASAFNVKFLDIGDTIKELRDFKPFQEYDLNEELLAYEESQNLSEILGERSITELGQRQLDLEINPIKSDVDIGKVNDPTNRRFREVPASEIRAASQGAYEEDIPKEYQKIVKTYFSEITKS